MEAESFESEETAAIMNKHFINIKVDREERPDVDRVYVSVGVYVLGVGVVCVWGGGGGGGGCGCGGRREGLAEGLKGEAEGETAALMNNQFHQHSSGQGGEA